MWLQIMELSKFLSKIRQQLRFILSVGVIGAVVFFGVAWRWPTRYQASLTVYVQKVGELVTTGEYTYDGFYAQQSAEKYTDTVVGLLESEDVLAQAIASDTGFYQGGVSEYRRRVGVEKIAPRLITVRVTLFDSDQARALVGAITTVAQERLSNLNQDPTQMFYLELIQTDPLVQVFDFSPWLFGLIGFGFFVMFGVSVIYFREYLKT